MHAKPPGLDHCCLCHATTAERVPDAVHCVQASSVPLVGVWVSGIASPAHPLVWLACLKFLVTCQLQDKVTQGNEAFLLLLYTTGQSTAFQANARQPCRQPCAHIVRAVQAHHTLPMQVCKALVTVMSA